jgi:hypothetical protein
MTTIDLKFMAKRFGIMFFTNFTGNLKKIKEKQDKMFLPDDRAGCRKKSFPSFRKALLRQ